MRRGRLDIRLDKRGEAEEFEHILVLILSIMLGIALLAGIYFYALPYLGVSK